MKITEVRVSLQPEEVLKGFVSVTFDDEFVVRGLKVIQSADGRFIAMPARRRRDGSYLDIAHPINREMREYLEEEVFRAYDEAVANLEDGGGGTENRGDDEDDFGSLAVSARA